MANCIIVGSGKIGSKLEAILRQKGHKILAIATQKAVRYEGGTTHITHSGQFAEITSALRPFCEKAHVVFLAIPTNDKGETARDYIRFFREYNLLVVTAEKGALAYFYEELLEDLRQGKLLGAAACGGGTDMVHSLVRRQLRDENLTAYIIANGTCNFLWTQASFAAALHAAKRNNYAEPGNGNEVDLINGELGGDLRKKICVIGNPAFAPRTGPFWNPDKIRYTRVRPHDLVELTSPSRRYRYVVTISSVLFAKEYADESPGFMYAEFDRWTVSGGFHNVGSDSAVDLWLKGVDDVGNGYLIHKALGEDTGHHIGGPGAGDETTAMQMYRDMVRSLGEE
jgi:homoserine dehydrogenase